MRALLTMALFLPLAGQPFEQQPPDTAQKPPDTPPAAGASAPAPDAKGGSSPVPSGEPNSPDGSTSATVAHRCWWKLRNLS